MMRKLGKIALIVVGVLVVALVALWLALDAIAKAGIERGAAYALGVPAHVDSVAVGVMSGKVRIDGLTLGNPEGFKTPHFMKTGRFDIAVRPGSLMEDTVEVTRFELDGLDLHIEQKLGSSNVTVILDNAKKVSGGPAAKDKEAGGKKVKVDRIVIRNVVAHVQVLPIGGSATTLDVKVPEIVMENVTSDNAGGVAVGELTRRLVPAILAAVVDKGKGIIPDGDLKKLGGDVAAGAQALGQGAARLVGQVGGEVGKALEGVGAGLKGAGEGIKKGLEGLFGGKKAPEGEKK
jgi:hypothetical protein